MRRKLTILVAVAAAFAAVAVLRWSDRRTTESGPAPVAGRLQLVELGSDKCAACQAMAPVLEALRRDHGAALDVVFIDVWKEAERAEPFGVRMIPTQVFIGPDGAELARHEGFFPADRIEARFGELGHALPARSATNGATDSPTDDGADGREP